MLSVMEFKGFFRNYTVERVFGERKLGKLKHLSYEIFIEFFKKVFPFKKEK